MNPEKNLCLLLKSIDGKDYGSYQSLKGSYDCNFYKLFIDHIPKDPYAPPFTGMYRVQIPLKYSYIPSDIMNNSIRKTAYIDFMTRRFFSESAWISHKRGTGNSGLITIDKPGQIILERNSLTIEKDSLEARFFLGLPAQGRIINSPIAETMIFKELPSILEKVFKRENIDITLCEKHLKTAENAEYIRSGLNERKLVSFIADGSLLPRISGSDDKPMDREKAHIFKSPVELKINFTLPDGTEISGMGIAEGLTTIVGGGYHGKSTVLQTIASGIYNHIPGDGRELAISKENTLKLRAYSGRFVEKVNISPFIGMIPSGCVTKAFSTQNASGSTSQAASLMEGLECGADVLLMDEDTCASNFMVRDERMQHLVLSEDEPITPFIDRIEQLFLSMGISTILVMGGSGDYFSLSHKVIQLKNYLPFDVTEKAHKIAEDSASGRINESEECHFKLKGRIPLPGSISPLNAYGKKSVYVKEIHRINFGSQLIDLTDMEQLRELSQTKAIMEAIQLAMKYIDGKRNLSEILQIIRDKIDAEGLDGLSDQLSGNLAGFRSIELAGTLNRLRSLKMLSF